VQRAVFRVESDVDHELELPCAGISDAVPRAVHGEYVIGVVLPIIMNRLRVANP